MDPVFNIALIVMIWALWSVEKLTNQTISLKDQEIYSSNLTQEYIATIQNLMRLSRKFISTGDKKYEEE